MIGGHVTVRVTVFGPGLARPNRGSHLNKPAMRDAPRGYLRQRNGAQGRWYISTMPQSLPLPPPGFDALPVEDQIDYVQSLWDRIAATAGQVPLQDWQQALLDERLAQHRRAPEEARPWEDVIERLQDRFRTER